jgi:hypothetical protein
MNNAYVMDENTVSLVSPDGEILCILPPEWLDENPGIRALTRLGYEQEKKLREIAERRWQEETGGIEVQGMSLDTGRESQALITGAALQATIDEGYSCRWKTAQGFAALTAAQIVAVAVAVRQHVQQCFDKEAGLAAQVMAAEDAEAVRAISWDGNE